MKMILLLMMSLPAWAWCDESYSPKLYLRTGASQYANEGTLGGAAGGEGGFDIQYVHYLNSRLAAGFGYSAQFDLTAGGVPVAGYEILGRYYFWHDGTQVTDTQGWGQASKQSLWSLYLMSMYGMRKYYLGQDLQSSDPTAQITGDYSVINLGVGLDYRLSRHFEFNIEINNSLYAFASSDSRVRISETNLLTGLSYVF
jgi:hypothetical protein